MASCLVLIRHAGFCSSSRRAASSLLVDMQTLSRHQGTCNNQIEVSPCLGGMQIPTPGSQFRGVPLYNCQTNQSNRRKPAVMHASHSGIQQKTHGKLLQGKRHKSPRGRQFRGACLQNLQLQWLVMIKNAKKQTLQLRKQARIKKGTKRYSKGSWLAMR